MPITEEQLKEWETMVRDEGEPIPSKQILILIREHRDLMQAYREALKEIKNCWEELKAHNIGLN